MAGISLNLDYAYEPAQVAIGRASVFMGLGLNAARSPALTDHTLAEPFNIQIVSSAPSPEQLQHYKDEFAGWIVGSGFRELTQGIEITLDRLFYAFCIAETRKQPDEGRLKKFHRKGLDRKIAELEGAFSFQMPGTEDYASLTLARNCLTHRRGIVDDPDVNDTSAGALAITWRAPHYEVHSDDGRVRPVTIGMLVEAGETLAIHYARKTERFARGTQIKLTGLDLQEICFMAYSDLARIHEETIRVLAGFGVKTPRKEEADGQPQ